MSLYMHVAVLSQTIKALSDTEPPYNFHIMPPAAVDPQGNRLFKKFKRQSAVVIPTGGKRIVETCVGVEFIFKEGARAPGMPDAGRRIQWRWEDAGSGQEVWWVCPRSWAYKKCVAGAKQIVKGTKVHVSIFPKAGDKLEVM